MEITLAPGGQYTHNAPQQQWRGQSNDLQTALFAGQELMAIRESDDSNVYELHFLGMKATGYASMENAKNAAPGFAIAVLDKLKASI